MFFFLQVSAKNALYESDKSEHAFIGFRKSSTPVISDLIAYDFTPYTVTLKWHTTLVNARFKIVCPSQRGYPDIEPQFTSDTTYTGE